MSPHPHPHPQSTKPGGAEQKALQMGPSALPVTVFREPLWAGLLLSLYFSLRLWALWVSLLPHKVSCRRSRFGGPGPTRHKRACYGQRFFVTVHHRAELLVYWGGGWGVGGAMSHKPLPGPRSHRQQRAEQWETHGCEHLVPPTSSLGELYTTDSFPKGTLSLQSCRVRASPRPRAPPPTPPHRQPLPHQPVTVNIPVVTS